MLNLDLRTAFHTEPLAHDFVIPGLIPGTVGALIAPGSTGKSMFALQLACAVACPTANTLELPVTQSGKVLYLNLEDPLSELHRRLFSLGGSFSAESRETLIANLTIEGEGSVDLLKDSCYQTVREKSNGKRLIIIDTLSKTHGLDENSNTDMIRLSAILNNLALSTKAAVLYLHHASKLAVLSGQGNTAQAARGASALIDSVRWCGNLRVMTEEEAKNLSVTKDRRLFVQYEVSKQNYGQIEDGIWFERTNGGLLRPTRFAKSSEKRRGYVV